MSPYDLIPITDELLLKWRLPSLAQSEGKEDRGRVLVIGGSKQVPGGVKLAAEATLRVGAGKLQIATAASAQPSMGVCVPEAKVSAIREDSGGNIVRIGRDLERDVGNADAVLVGPGMETCAGSGRLVRQVARACRSPLVLDAGALEGFRASPQHMGPDCYAAFRGDGPFAGERI